jgi:hypothetical protein
MFAAVFVTPSMTTHGTPTADRCIGRDRAPTPPGSPGDRPDDRRDDGSGRGRLGCHDAEAGASSSPRATSTTPTLMPLPPTSTPIADVAGIDRVRVGRRSSDQK